MLRKRYRDLQRICVSCCGTEELIEPFDARETSKDLTSYLQPKGY
jgi:hypothetical protein